MCTSLPFLASRPSPAECKSGLTGAFAYPDLGKQLALRPRQRKLRDLSDQHYELHFTGAEVFFFDFTTVTSRFGGDNQNGEHQLRGLTG